MKSPIWGIGCFFPDKIEPLVSLCSRAMKIVTGFDIGPTGRDQIRLSGGLLCSRPGKATLIGAHWICFISDELYPHRRSQRQPFRRRSARRGPDTGGMPRPLWALTVPGSQARSPGRGQRNRASGRPGSAYRQGRSSRCRGHSRPV